MFKRIIAAVIVSAALFTSYTLGHHNGYKSGAQWTDQQEVNTFNDGWMTALYGDGKQ